MFYSTVIAPLFQLIKKDISFVQGLEQDRIIDKLKIKITFTLALVTIKYKKDSGEVFIKINASLVKQGSYLS